jgi:HK97 family phage major capsid protein
MATDQRLLAAKASGLNEAIPSQGGFLVPPELNKTIIDSMFRPGSLLGAMRVENVSSNRLIYNVIAETSRADGSRYGGLLGYWLAEAASKSSSKPAYRQLDIGVNKIAVLAYATDELLADAQGLESWLNNAVPDELRFRVEDAIINGDGIGKPLGILTNTAALTSATRTDASEIDAYDIGRMWAGRIAGFNDYIWVGNQNIFPQLLNLVVGTTPVFLPAGGMGGLPYSTILGRPYFDLEYCPALGTAGDLLLFSPSAYKLIQNGGINSQSSIHVKFESDETTFRWVYRVGGAPVYNAQVTGKDSGSYSPYVVLTAST